MPVTSKRSGEQSRTASLTGKDTKRLRISIVGAGRLGTTLGSALHHAGHRIEIVVSRHVATSRRASAAVNSRSLAATIAQLQDKDSPVFRKLCSSDLIIIATPDVAIEPVATRLAALVGSEVTASTKNRTVLHTSGALSSRVLNPLRLAGFATGSLHPLVSVSDAKSSRGIFRGVYFCVEGDARAVRLARTLVSQLSGRSFTIKSESKPLYHAAAVMTSGHVVALFDLALLMLRKCGLSSRDAQRVFMPLLRSTTTNLEKNTPTRALTGPYARGDFETARKHLSALQESGLDDVNEIYRILARHSLALGKTLKRDPNFELLARLLDHIS